MRGRKLSLPLSVKHYETRIVKFIPIKNNEQLVLHPILNIQTRYPFKMLNVASYKDCILFKSSSSNEHIHIANSKTLLFEFPSYFSVFAGILNRIFLKEIGNLSNIVKMFLPA